MRYENGGQSEAIFFKRNRNNEVDGYTRGVYGKNGRTVLSQQDFDLDWNLIK